MAFPDTLAIFCKVVDNFGDIGICWRLARQMRHEHGLDITLWVDDLDSFRRICPQVDPAAGLQRIGGVSVRHWRDQERVFAATDIADIVIEFFGCDIPPGYIKAMAGCNPRPVWLNLEGLSAEEWVEGCHSLPSTHPRLPLVKHFFFPGFTARTGGLLMEAGLDAERTRFQSDPSVMAAFLATLGLTPQEIAARKVSMFCYPHAPVGALFDVWQHADRETVCLIPEGVAAEAVSAFFGGPARAGAVCSREALTLRVLPFIPQPDYDRLLWACDLNFVRGEDSFVRAQWAARPFVWHIYPQDENLHHVKLRAFLQRYAPALPNLSGFSLAWNGASSEDVGCLWPGFQAEMPEMTVRAGEWLSRMQANGDLAANLLKFAIRLRSEAG